MNLVIIIKKNMPNGGDQRAMPIRFGITTIIA